MQDIWLSPPTSALQRWQEAGLRPISGALAADYAVICPRDAEEDAWLMFRVPPPPTHTHTRLRHSH